MRSLISQRRETGLNSTGNGKSVESCKQRCGVIWLLSKPALAVGGKWIVEGQWKEAGRPSRSISVVGREDDGPD